MSARAYAIRLGLVAFIFGVAIPGFVGAVLYLLEADPQSRQTALGFAFAAYFLGMPAWIISLAIALWWTVERRVVAVGLPYAISLCFVPLVLADWGAVMTFFQGRTPPFLITAATVLVALIFWPDRRATGTQMPAPVLMARGAAVVSLVIQSGLATLSVIGSIARAFVLSSLTFTSQFLPQRLASLWLWVVMATQIGAIAAIGWWRSKA